MGPWLGVAANVALRASIAYFLYEVLRNPEDPRFAGKAIPIRNLVIVGGMSLIVPVLHFVFRRWERYPLWTDDLWLSVFWLDMAGNSFDLYDTYERFDLIPHFHGTGAATIVIGVLSGVSDARTLVIGNAAHALLEAQEILTDVFAGTHNVRGPLDTIGDLAAGVLGSFAYVRLFRGLRLLRFVRILLLLSRLLLLRRRALLAALLREGWTGEDDRRQPQRQQDLVSIVRSHVLLLDSLECRQIVRAHCVRIGSR